MNSRQNNKFTKTVSQFYFQPSNPQQLLRISNPTFFHKPRHFRINNALQITHSFTSRKEQSLSNYPRLSQVIQAQQKVFRSSSSFMNPQKAELIQSSKKVNSLLKSHILSREFQERKRSKMFQSQREQERDKGQSVSNYRYFAGGRRKDLRKANEGIMTGSLSLNVQNR